MSGPPPNDLLRSVALFAHLREDDRTALNQLMRQQEYPKNRIILSAHEPCDGFYILLSGQVKVMLVAEDGREVILSLIRKGDFFGERSLLDDEPHAASVIAMEDSRMAILHRDAFRRCIVDMPGVAVGLLRVLLRRLRAADSRIGGLILLDVTGRVSRLLLQLADWGDGTQILSPPTHQIIGQMVGSSRESVSRTLSALVDRGAISTSRKGIVIRDRRQLEMAAGDVLQTLPAERPQQERRSSSGLPRLEP